MLKQAFSGCVSAPQPDPEHGGTTQVYTSSDTIPNPAIPASTRLNSIRVTVIDRPCGSGKSTMILRSLERHKRYLIVVPLLTEVTRFMTEARFKDGGRAVFHQPEDLDDDHKLGNLLDLLGEGKNVITTHALYSVLAAAAGEGFLTDYDIIIDEVLDVVKQVPGVSAKSWAEVYVKGGWAVVDEDGKCKPTSKWELNPEGVADTLNLSLYRQAKAGCLYVVDDTFFLWALPPILLQTGCSFTVYTYLAEGSMLLPYLRKKGISYRHNRDDDIDLAFRAKAKSLITVKSIPSLEGYKWSYTGQTRKASKDQVKKTSVALANLRQREVPDVPADKIMLTCAKFNWFHNASARTGKESAIGFAKGSRMFTVNWVANTTRGTNDYIECSHAIYLWDQYLNPYITRWLGLADDKSVDSTYAITELVQWLYRTRVRRGDAVTVYVPSERMRLLLEVFLDGDDIKDRHEKQAA